MAKDRILVRGGHLLSMDPSIGELPQGDVLVEDGVILAVAPSLGEVDAEVIDLRTLLPVDIEAIAASVNKTGRCVIVHEATRTSGFGAELSALVQENCFYRLEAPIERVTGWDTPYPHAQEWDYFPGPARVGRALLDVMGA